MRRDGSHIGRLGHGLRPYWKRENGKSLMRIILIIRYSAPAWPGRCKAGSRRTRAPYNSAAVLAEQHESISEAVANADADQPWVDMYGADLGAAAVDIATQLYFLDIEVKQPVLVQLVVNTGLQGWAEAVAL